mmetsp:Transcript_17334/g.58559  ORF Transcript_17334/g.58559 Transcript_17334/m.58559 type:complete len:448 (+) Transcript_17334:796-2139(+)
MVADERRRQGGAAAAPQRLRAARLARVRVVAAVAARLRRARRLDGPRATRDELQGARGSDAPSRAECRRRSRRRGHDVPRCEEAGLPLGAGHLQPHRRVREYRNAPLEGQVRGPRARDPAVRGAAERQPHGLCHRRLPEHEGGNRGDHGHAPHGRQAAHAGPLLGVREPLQLALRAGRLLDEDGVLDPAGNGGGAGRRPPRARQDQRHARRQAVQGAAERGGQVHAGRDRAREARHVRRQDGGEAGRRVLGPLQRQHPDGDELHDRHPGEGRRHGERDPRAPSRAREGRDAHGAAAGEDRAPRVVRGARAVPPKCEAPPVERPLARDGPRHALQDGRAGAVEERRRHEPRRGGQPRDGLVGVQQRHRAAVRRRAVLGWHGAVQRPDAAQGGHRDELCAPRPGPRRGPQRALVADLGRARVPKPPLPRPRRPSRRYRRQGALVKTPQV